MRKWGSEKVAMRRWKVLLLREAGWTRSQIARMVKISETRVRQICNEFDREEGLGLTKEQIQRMFGV